MDTVAAGVRCDLIFDMMKKHRSEYILYGERVSNVSRVDNQSMVKSISNVRSNTDLHCTADCTTTGEVSLLPLDVLQDDKTIHSGHFMVSHVHEEDLSEEILQATLVKDDVTDEESETELVECPPSSASPSSASAAICAAGLEGETVEDRNSLAIDKTLTKLFECMTLAYSGKLKTPKWKNFKKIRVGLKDKIRLNNLIWREWHMQYKKGRAAIGCQFVTRVPEKPTYSSMVGEQMAQYWKERLQKLVRDYNNWQPLLYRKLQLFDEENPLNIFQATTKPASNGQWCIPTEDMLLSDEFVMDLSDTLFSSLNSMNQPLSSRDLYLLGNVTADIMQPDLDPLVPMQPCLEDFMDTLDAPMIRGFTKPSSNLSSINWLSDVVGDQSFNVRRVRAEPDVFGHVTEQQHELQNVTTEVYEDEDDDESCDRTVLFEAGTTQDLFSAGDTLYDDVDQQLFDSVDDPGSLVPFELASGVQQQLDPISFSQSLKQESNPPLQTSSFQRPPTALASQNLSFGSSEEVLLMLQNQLLLDGATAAKKQPATDGCASNTDLVSVAFSDDVLQQLFLMFMRDSAPPSHAMYTLPSIAEAPAQNTGSVAIVQPILHVLQADTRSQSTRQLSNYLKLEPGLVNVEGKPTQSCDNLYQLIADNDVSGGCRRASTGSLNSMHPASTTFKAPQRVFATISNCRPAESVADGGSSSNRTILPKPSTFIQASGNSPSYLMSLQCAEQRKVSNVSGSVPSFTLSNSIGTMLTPSGANCAISAGRTLLPRAASNGTIPMASAYCGTMPTRSGSSGAVTSVGIQPCQRRNSFLEHLLTSDSVGSKPVRKLSGEGAPIRTRHKSDQSKPGIMLSNSSPYSTTTLPHHRNITDMRGANAVFQPINPLAAIISNQKQSLHGHSGETQSLQPKATLSKVSKVMNLQQQAAAMSASSSNSTLSTLNPSESPQIHSLRSPSSDPAGLQLAARRSLGRSRHASSDAATSNRLQQQVACDSPQLSTASSDPLHQEQRRENRRVSHITAEQRRRGNIKSGFDVLNQLIPSLSQSTNVKISKATTLLKAAEMFRRLKQERIQMVQETEQLQEQIKMFESVIRSFQSQLPESGMTRTVSRQSSQFSQQSIESYIATRVVGNWKFWIFGNIIRSLFDSYNNSVSTASVEDMCRTLLEWIRDHCSLAALRQVVTGSLRQLSMTTSILTNPSDVPNQLTQIARDQLAGHR